MLNTAGILSKMARVTSLLRLNNRFGQSSGCVVCNSDGANGLSPTQAIDNFKVVRVVPVATTLATRTVNSGKRRLDKQTGSLAWYPRAI